MLIILGDSVNTNIIVHITGEVNSPGIVHLTDGARIIDAIDNSGGTTADADLSKINLAYELKDGQKIYVPSIYDDEPINYISNSSGDGVLENENADKKTVNINTATQSELETLPGIGESTASKIIEYREKYGDFQSIEDIKNVSRYWRFKI